ncbi:MAG: tryptophan synthase subunit alpha [Bacteroidota bacterium]
MNTTADLSRNRIDRLFSNRKEPVLSVYLTAGYPGPDDTVPLIQALADSGVDMIEVGMPFSDPLADGKVIQGSSQVALRNGMSVRRLFEQLAGIREHVSIPLVLMGYLNPVLQFGIKDFLSACRETGIDGLILPDLPLREYEAHYRDLFTEYGIHLILLITPQTEPERVKKIASLTGGFLYMVAASSTTGRTGEFSDEQLEYFKRIRDMKPGVPCLIGFGISDKKGFKVASEYADGAIIGSALIRALGQEGDPAALARDFIRPVKG